MRLARAQATDGIAARSFAAVLLAGVLTGSELTSWGIVHPTLWKLDHAEQVRAEKLMYRRFGSVDPFVMTATITACFVAAHGRNGRRSTLATGAGVCYSLMLAITLVGNMPINLRVLRWDEAHDDAHRWRALRRRWDRLHDARVALDCAGFALIILAALDV